MRIIVADDQEAARSMYAMMLAEFDCEVVVVPGGQEALEAACRQKPDLFILDHYMPGMTGHEAVKSIRSNSYLKDVPVLFITAKDFDNSLREMTKTEVQEFLAKPFTMDGLIKAMEKALRRPLSRK